jgi:hypothetical protein
MAQQRYVHQDSGIRLKLDTSSHAKAVHSSIHLESYSAFLSIGASGFANQKCQMNVILEGNCRFDSSTIQITGRRRKNYHWSSKRVREATHE